MNSAPAVGFPLGRSRFQAWLIGVVLGLGGAVVMLWLVHSDGGDGRQYLALAGWLWAAGWMGLEWWRTPQGTLQWDGVAWTLLIGSRSVLVVPAMVLDFQRMVLLRLQATGSVTWAWLDQSNCPARWLALRRAVYEPARGAEPGDPSHRISDLSRGGQ